MISARSVSGGTHPEAGERTVSLRELKVDIAQEVESIDLASDLLSSSETIGC